MGIFETLGVWRRASMTQVSRSLRTSMLCSRTFRMANGRSGGWASEDASPAPRISRGDTSATPTDRNIDLTLELRHRLQDADGGLPGRDAPDPEHYDLSIPAVTPAEWHSS